MLSRRLYRTRKTNYQIDTTNKQKTKKSSLETIERLGAKTPVTY